MRKNNTRPNDLSEDVRLLESLVVPVPEILSYCFVCHHQERFSRLNPAFDCARVEAAAFRPDKDSLKRFGLIVRGPEWH
jgi:hypothetical protein